MQKTLAGVGWLLLAAPIVRADVVAVQKVEEAGKPHASQITMKVKGDKIRTDVTPDTSTITDTASGETITLKHPQKVYVKISGDAAQELAKQMERIRAEKRKQGIPEEPTAKLEATGKHETVGGYDTKIYAAQIGAMKMTYWVAQNYPDAEKFLGFFNQLQKTAMAKLARDMTQLPEALEFSGIPVKTEMVTPDGRKIVTTLLSMKEQPLEDIDFTVPADYRELPTPLFGPSAPLKTP